VTEVLALDGVSRRFGRRTVVRAATLRVHAGETVTLLGRNGSGKTTLLRIAAGLLRADTGHVRLAGDRVTRPRLHRLAERGLFLLPERGLLTPTATVRGHFDRIAARWGGDPAEAIDRLGVAPFLDRYPVQISGGERRRVELALALARRPACLLADEPFHGIAPRTAELIVDALRHLRHTGCAVLLTGHEVETILDVADTVVWMSAGTTHALGAPAAARTHHSFRLDYLGRHRGSDHG
jgi:ABC-type multidrug transport system ATPase subunit